MKYILFIFLFSSLFSCSIKNNFKSNPKTTEQTTNSSFLKIDTDKDNKISQKEFIKFENNKKLVNSTVDYQTPLLVFCFILLIVLSLCSLTYIVYFFKRIYFYIKNLFVK